MYKLIKLIAILLSVQVYLNCEECETKRDSKTYEQNFSKYSISLPENWTLVGDERDIFEPKTVSGLARYTPGPGRDIASAEWLNAKEMEWLHIIAMKRESGTSASTLVKELEYAISKNGKIIQKGTATFKGQNSYWRMGRMYNGYVYMQVFSHNDRFYSVTFGSYSEITPEKQALFDATLSTFTFLE